MYCIWAVSTAFTLSTIYVSISLRHAESTSCASSPRPPRSWAALTASCSITSTTSASTPRTGPRTGKYLHYQYIWTLELFLLYPHQPVLFSASAGTPAQRTPSAPTVATPTAPVPNCRYKLAVNLFILNCFRSESEINFKSIIAVLSINSQ